jgi:hypothetical protein
MFGRRRFLCHALDAVCLAVRGSVRLRQPERLLGYEVLTQAATVEAR